MSLIDSFFCFSSSFLFLDVVLFERVRILIELSKMFVEMAMKFKI